MLRLTIRHSRLRTVAAAAAIAILPVGITFASAAAAPAATATVARAARQVSPPRPQGPCDIYAAGGTPCVAAYSTTRALYASYNGPLYQVMRLSDNAVKDIGVVRQHFGSPDSGGFADAAEQDEFCANTTCVITKIYDQSPSHNDLTQAPRGAFGGPAMGGYDNLPIADMAPVTVSGHKAYGVFIAPGMGLRDNNTNGIATGDQPEGEYMVTSGKYYTGGCWVSHLWFILDLLVYHRLLEACFAEGLQLEVRHPWLPRIRQNMRGTLEGKGVLPRVRLFYQALVVLFPLVAGFGFGAYLWTRDRVGATACAVALALAGGGLAKIIRRFS